MKIISGGQIGADIAALQSAKEVGYETGGWMPKGFLTKNGPKPEYAEMYGMIETADGGYPVRTRLNVGNSDVTIRYGSNFSSYGEQLTARLIGEFKVPHLDIHVHPTEFNIFPDPWYLADWLLIYKPEIINVAGNSYPKIESTVQLHFTKALRMLKAHGL
jgi:hypothetical protein